MIQEKQTSGCFTNGLKSKSAMESLLTKYGRFFPDIDGLFDFQENAIERLIAGENVLSVVPTGGGKSLIFQLTALHLKGVVIVISPLVALMEEQVAELNKRGISALGLNSSIPFDQQRKILRGLRDSQYKLIYLSPERLQNPFFRSALIASGVEVSMVVIDEAHCISQWGGSFRPDYGQINPFLEFLGNHQIFPNVLCLTATLSKAAREDIAAAFHIKPENVQVTGNVLRANLNLQLTKVKKEKDKPQVLQDFLEKHQPQKTIAYLYSKKKCESFAKDFSGAFQTDFFHAGRDQDSKKSVYDRFKNGQINLLFATTAFGMGINIPDIDCVAQIQLAHSIEEYYQQVGRGWRNKTIPKVCNCLALWSDVNFERRKEGIEKERFSVEGFWESFEKLLGKAKSLSVGKIVNRDKDALVNSPMRLQLLRYALEKQGVIRTIGEMNGSPMTIEFVHDTPLWSSIRTIAKKMDSFSFAAKSLGLTHEEIFRHLYEQELAGNIKKLPATRRDIYFEILQSDFTDGTVEEILALINQDIDFRHSQLSELRGMFESGRIEEELRRVLG
jgi:ATP-dependent DNA helicase RecQ